MTWVGFYAVFICLFAFAGNFVQWRAYRAIVEDSRIKRVLLGGLLAAFILNSILLLGVLFVGTGSL